MDNIYEDSKYGFDIKGFTNDLVNYKQRYVGKSENSIFIVMSNRDRKSWFWTGNNLRQKIGNVGASLFMENMSYFKRGEYITGLCNMLDKLWKDYFVEDNDREYYSNNYSADSNFDSYSADSYSDSKNNLFKFLITTIIIITLLKIYKSNDKSKDISKDIPHDESKLILPLLKKLREIYNKKLSIIDFATSHCFICMDELENINMPIKKYECEHSFHKKCMEEWMELEENCPICKFGIFYNHNSSLTHQLINIQSIIHPSLKDLQFHFTTDDIFWNHNENLINNHKDIK